jgi:hypothetical protein
MATAEATLKDLTAQIHRPLAVCYGYVLGAGNKLVDHEDANHARTVILAHGEGEWDGIEWLFVNRKRVDHTNANFVHFHPGGVGVLGTGMVPVSTGGDQGVDTFWNNIPTIAPVTLSGIAYTAIYIPPDPGAPNADLEIIGKFRSKKVRTFDASGATTAYAFSTNPWWCILDRLIKRFIQPEAVPNTNLTAAEKARINFQSFIDQAAYADANIGGGIKRFELSLGQAVTVSGTQLMEKMLTCCRGYILEVNGQLTAFSDKARASVFTLTADHIVAGSAKFNQEQMENSASRFTGAFNDLTVPQISPIDTVGNSGVQRAANIVTVKCTAAHGKRVGDSVQLIGVTDNSFNVVAEISKLLPGGNFQFKQAGANAVSGGGYVGAVEQQFAQATKILNHDAYQRTLGQRGVGLTVLQKPLPLDIDYGNNTPERVERLLTYQKCRDLGPDATPYIGPWQGSVDAFWDSVDAGNNLLKAVLPGEIITIDKTVSEEYAGDYEVIDLKTPKFTAGSGDSQDNSQSDLTISLNLKQYVPEAFTDVAGAQAVTSPTNSLLPPIDLSVPVHASVIHIARATVNGVAAVNSYRTISRKQYLITAGDFLEYDIFQDPDNPKATGGLDFAYNNDASFFRSTNTLDQNRLSNHPSTDIGATAIGKWYHRSFSLAAFVGQTISSWASGIDVGAAGNAADNGVYRSRIANVKITNGGGLVAAIFSMNLLGNSPAFGPGDANVTDVHIYTADNAGNISFPGAGKELLPNPGFESNVVQSPTGTSLTLIGSLVSDGWEIFSSTGAPGTPIWEARIEENNTFQKTGLRSLLISLRQNVVIANGTTPELRVMSDFFPVTQNQVLAFKAQVGLWRSGAPPAGLTPTRRVGVMFFNAQGAFISEVNVDNTTATSAYAEMLAQALVPSGAAYGRLQLVGFVSNTSGGAINTGANLYGDMRFDDCSLINKTRSFDNVPLDTAVTPTIGGAAILTQSGTTTTINVAAFTAKRGFGNVSYNSGSVNPGAYGAYLVYTKDITYSGGAQTFLATLLNEDLSTDEGVVYIGKITTVAGGGGSGGGGGLGGSGPCVVPETPVKMWDGDWLPMIEAVQSGRLWFSPYGPDDVESWEIVPDQELFDVELVDGQGVRCSGFHSIRNWGVWNWLKDIFIDPDRGAKIWTEGHEVGCALKEIKPAGRGDVVRVRLKFHHVYLAGSGGGIWSHNAIKQ